MLPSSKLLEVVSGRGCLRRLTAWAAAASGGGGSSGGSVVAGLALDALLRTWSPAGLVCSLLRTPVASCRPGAALVPLVAQCTCGRAVLVWCT